MKKKRKFFISHAWEDKSVVKRVEKSLKVSGFEVWVDHSGTRIGDNLPKRISDALDWCNTLLLFWSASAKASHWVELEWTSGISLRKAIIPCILDETELPAILKNTLYLKFSSLQQGIEDLISHFQPPPVPKKARRKAETKRVPKPVNHSLTISGMSNWIKIVPGGDPPTLYGENIVGMDNRYNLSLPKQHTLKLNLSGMENEIHISTSLKGFVTIVNSGLGNRILYD